MQKRGEGGASGLLYQRPVAFGFPVPQGKRRFARFQTDITGDTPVPNRLTDADIEKVFE